MITHKTFYLSNKVIPEKDCYVAKRNHSRDLVRPWKHQYRYQEQYKIGKGKVLYLDRNNEEQHQLKLGIKQGKSKEQRHIEIKIRRVAYDKATDYRSDNSAQIKEIEAKCSPLSFKGGAYHPVKIQREYNKYKTALGRQKCKGKDSPYLTR